MVATTSLTAQLARVLPFGSGSWMMTISRDELTSGDDAGADARMRESLSRTRASAES